jgi:hypothetical protein
MHCIGLAAHPSATVLAAAGICGRKSPITCLAGDHCALILLTLPTHPNHIHCSVRLWESVLMTNSTAKPALLAATNSKALLENTILHLQNISQTVAAAVGPKPPLHLQPPPPQQQPGHSAQGKNAASPSTTTSSSSSTTGQSAHVTPGELSAAQPVTVDQTRISNSASSSSSEAGSSSNTPAAASRLSSSTNPGQSSDAATTTDSSSGSGITGSISAGMPGYSTMVTGGGAAGHSGSSTSSSGSITSDQGAGPVKQSGYEQAARSGFLLAALANTRLFPELLPSSSEQELQWLQVAAQAGSVDAQLALADRFMTGRGVEPDCEHGIYYLKLAAAQVVTQVEKVRASGVRYWVHLC